MEFAGETLDPAARFEYLIAYRNRFVLDPGNPLTVPLERRSLSVRYVESAEGHNHSAFRARRPSLMARLFPVDSGE